MYCSILHRQPATHLLPGVSRPLVEPSNTIGGFSSSADRWVSEDYTMREDQAIGSALEIKGPARQVIGVGAVVVTLLALSLAMITIWAQMIIAL